MPDGDTRVEEWCSRELNIVKIHIEFQTLQSTMNRKDRIMASKSTLFESFKSVRNSFRKWLPGLFVLGKGLTLIYSRRSFLRESGYFKSVALKRPCRLDGSPIPWMNYGAINFLENRLGDDLDIFEYGSGNSTIFFAKLVNSVTSLECDHDWYEYVKGILPENSTVMFCPIGNVDYVDTISKQEMKFDVVVVDAEERVKCLLNAPDYISDRGVIILDDAARPEYREGVAELCSRGFRVLPLDGMKAGGINTYRTSIFYRDNNCLGI